MIHHVPFFECDPVDCPDHQAVVLSTGEVVRAFKDWRPICGRCGGRYVPEPCCEGPCVHEADRPNLCNDCDHALYVEAMSRECEHGSTVGHCLLCHLDEEA